MSRLVPADWTAAMDMQCHVKDVLDTRKLVKIGRIPILKMNVNGFCFGKDGKQNLY